MRPFHLYLLDKESKKILACKPNDLDRLLKYNRNFSSHETLGNDEAFDPKDNVSYRVSTVFLGVNVGYEDKPLVFETMVFRLLEDGATDWTEVYVERYETYDQAMANHNLVVSTIKEEGISSLNEGPDEDTVVKFLEEWLSTQEEN